MAPIPITLSTYVVTLKVLGVAGITTERLLCKDVNKSLTAPAPPDRMRAQVVLCQNSVPCGESQLSSILQRSSAKEDVSARIGGKQRFLAIWSELQAVPGITFDVELPKIETTKKSAAAAIRISRKNYELLVFLSDGELSTPIAAANLTISTGQAFGIRDLPLYNIESDFSALSESSKKSGSPFANVGDKMKALQAAYRIDSLDSVLRVQLNIEIKSILPNSEKLKSKANVGVRESLMLHTSKVYKEGKNKSEEERVRAFPKIGISRVQSAKEKKAYGHGKIYLKRRASSFRVKNENSHEAIATKFAYSVKPAPLPILSKISSAKLPKQEEHGGNSEAGFFKGSVSDFSQGSDIASIIGRTKILIEHRSETKSSHQSFTQSEVQSYDDSESSDDESETSYQLQLPQSLQRAIRMLDRISSTTCVAKEDSENSSLDDSINRPDVENESFIDNGCVSSRDKTRLRASGNEAMKLLQDLACWQIDSQNVASTSPTGSYNKQKVGRGIDEFKTRDDDSYVNNDLRTVNIEDFKSQPILDNSSKTSQTFDVLSSVPVHRGNYQMGQNTLLSRESSFEKASLAGAEDFSSLICDIDDSFYPPEHVEMQFNDGLSRLVIENTDLSKNIKKSQVLPTNVNATKNTKNMSLACLDTTPSLEKMDLNATERDYTGSQTSHCTPPDREESIMEISPVAVNEFDQTERSAVNAFIDLFRRPSEILEHGFECKPIVEPSMVFYKDDAASVGELTLTSFDSRVDGDQSEETTIQSLASHTTWDTPVIFSSVFSCGSKSNSPFDDATTTSWQKQQIESANDSIYEKKSLSIL